MWALDKNQQRCLEEMSQSIVGSPEDTLSFLGLINNSRMHISGIKSCTLLQRKCHRILCVFFPFVSLDSMVFDK